MQNCALVVQYLKMLNLSIKLICSVTCFACLKVVWLHNLFEGMDTLRLYKLSWACSLPSLIFFYWKFHCVTWCQWIILNVLCFSHLSKTLMLCQTWLEQTSDYDREIVDGSFCDSTLNTFWQFFLALRGKYYWIILNCSILCSVMEALKGSLDPLQWVGRLMFSGKENYYFCHNSKLSDACVSVSSFEIFWRFGCKLFLLLHLWASQETKHFFQCHNPIIFSLSINWRGTFHSVIALALLCTCIHTSGHCLTFLKNQQMSSVTSSLLGFNILCSCAQPLIPDTFSIPGILDFSHEVVKFIFYWMQLQSSVTLHWQGEQI